MSLPALDALPPLPPGTLRRLTVAQYDAMGRAGILGPDDRVELLEGWLVEKMTKNPPHRIVCREVRVLLERLVPPAWYVEAQEPIVTADSEPEPDVAIIRGQSRDYATSNPPASAVGLVIEVADTSLARDREIKGRIYARAGIARYWLLDLTARSVEVYTRPTGTGAAAVYAERVDVPADGELLVELDGVSVGTVSVAALFR